jgi:hypothetical protein
MLGFLRCDPPDIAAIERQQRDIRQAPLLGSPAAFQPVRALTGTRLPYIKQKENICNVNWRISGEYWIMRLKSSRSA